MEKLSSLQTKKFYRVKSPKREFLCALCSAPRQMKHSKNLHFINYMQVLVLSAAFIWLCLPFMGAKSLFVFFPVWMAFEIGNKLLYRKELPCPYCGFDPTWYRRDVKVANKLIRDFWEQNYPELVKHKQGEPMVSHPPVVSPQTNEDASAAKS
jgi:hypothetical protein